MALQNSRSAGLTRKGAETRVRILETATKLFAAHGFEATTFAMIGKDSGAAISSIVNCFSDKATLAETIYAAAMDRLVVAVARAIDRNPVDVPRTIHAVISACFSWAEAHPGDATLFRVLREHAGPRGAGDERVHLEPLIAAWAQPLIRAALLQPLEPAQLYAAIISPALCGAMASGSLLNGHPPAISWTSVLSTAALAAVQPRTTRPRPAKALPGDAGDKWMALTVPAPPTQGHLL